MNKKGFTKMTWLIFLVTYLFLLSVVFYYVGDTFGSGTEFYSSTQQAIGDGATLNIVTGISILPLWLNILFVVIPLIFLGYILFYNSVPTVNTGA